ncbi:MAG: TonB family protein [Acidobacteria bacterium]|nr:TonB family protein [Acidobacteriota bacterium]
MAHQDILDQHEPFKAPLLASAGLHVGVAALIAALTWVASEKREQWGDPKSLGGGAVGITPVTKIPLPPRAGRINPVANDTESAIPSPPRPRPKETVREEPNAVAIKSRRRPKRAEELAASRQKYSPVKEPRPNQVYSRTGQAAVSPLFTPAQGGGGVGSNAASPFGNRFGWYEQLLREKVARAWNTAGLDPRTPAAMVGFQLLRDGSVRELHVEQSSGNFMMDQSAQRAILQAAPLPPLPREYEHEFANITFRFTVQQ